MRAPTSAVICAALFIGCGDDSSATRDAPVAAGDAAAGDGAAAKPDAAAAGPDAAESVDAAPGACDGLEQGTCTGTDGCAPGCFSLCDCTCPGPPGFEGCGCDECSATCFTYQECVDISDFVECGPNWCDPATEICVGRAGGVAILWSCQPVPAGCAADRSCGCVASSLCIDAFDLCIDGPGDDTVRCECPKCA
jgi:hypothetical protein